MIREAKIHRKTKETDIHIHIILEGSGSTRISTQIPFFDHMLTAFAVHGFFDLTVDATGDIEVDLHHTVEDIGIVLGQTLSKALDNRIGINRYGEGAVPMDDALTRVNIDLSNRPYLIYNFPKTIRSQGDFNVWLAREFFQAFCVHGGLNLHINTFYGENEHHILESMFKACGRALNAAVKMNQDVSGVLSSKGTL